MGERRGREQRQRQRQQQQCIRDKKKYSTGQGRINELFSIVYTSGQWAIQTQTPKPPTCLHVADDPNVDDDRPCSSHFLLAQLPDSRQKLKKPPPTCTGGTASGVEEKGGGKRGVFLALPSPWISSQVPNPGEFPQKYSLAKHPALFLDSCPDGILLHIPSVLYSRVRRLRRMRDPDRRLACRAAGAVKHHSTASSSSKVRRGEGMRVRRRRPVPFAAGASSSLFSRPFERS